MRPYVARFWVGGRQYEDEFDDPLIAGAYLDHGTWACSLAADGVFDADGNDMGWKFGMTWDEFRAVLAAR